MPERVERWLARVTGDFVASDGFERFARLGYASKGAVFGIVGGLAIARGVGVAREAEDTPGAVEAIRDIPLYPLLLAALALGLTGYALWRFVQALLDTEGEGLGAWGLAKRALYLGVGGFYLYLAVFAILVIFGPDNSDGDGIQDFTATVLGWPGGRVLVGLVGLGVIAAGLTEIAFALRGAYREEFRHRRMAGWEKALLAGAGWWGHVGRGGFYALLGYLAIRAAITFDADEAAGLGEGLRKLQEQDFGPPLVVAAGVSFVCFGIYSGIIALHGELEPDDAVHGSLEET